MKIKFRCNLLLFLLLTAVVVAPGAARAATLTDAVVALFSTLSDNLFCRGRVAAVLDEQRELILEFGGRQVPHEGAELVVYEVSERDDDKPEKTFARRPVGIVTVVESAGPVARAVVVKMDEPAAPGQEVMVEPPVRVYITPVQNIIGYPPLTREAVEVIALQAAAWPALKITGIARVDRGVIETLRRQVAESDAGYGLLIQPYLLTVNGQAKVQFKLQSLYSGQSVGVLSEDFFSYPAAAGGAPVSPSVPAYPPPPARTR
ncbi:MAG: hypothetical protein JW781_10250 [Deltaproteobacteria bacterium]|nr:hypothetical protein [Candidatus Anaeroferrophillacea bacterium]